MATITGHKSVLTGGLWKDDYEYESGPEAYLESSELDRIMQVLPNLWDKGWQWATVCTTHYVFTFYRGGNMFFKKRENV